MQLEIKYTNGKMTIFMDKFFPTSQARLKKLLKVIELDFNGEEHIQTLKQFFVQKIKELEGKHSVIEQEVKRYNKQIEQFTKHLEILEKRK